jgi:tetratricopeptide (TPR) repeat protein
MLAAETKAAMGRDDLETANRLSMEGIDRTTPEQVDYWYQFRMTFVTSSLDSTSEADTKKALVVCNEVLSSLRRSNNAKKWARVHMIMGLIYGERKRWRRQNTAKALQHYRKALTVYTRKTDQENWALIKSDIGLLYSERRTGSTKMNLREAIRSTGQALQVLEALRPGDDYSDLRQRLVDLKRRLAASGFRAGGRKE